MKLDCPGINENMKSGTLRLLLLAHSLIQSNFYYYYN